MKVSLQTYTIRKLAKVNLDASLELVRKQGFEYLEVARLPFTKEVATKILKHDLKVLSIQAKYRTLKNQYNKIVAFCKYTNCQIAVVSVLPFSAILGGKKQIINFSKRLNVLFKKYASVGITLAFHNHDFEFQKIKNKTKFDYLLENTNGVKIVADTYWIKKSGYVPEDFIKSLGERLIGVHLRDYIEINKGKKKIIKDTEIGQGFIDFKKVLENANQAVYGAIEQNTINPIYSINFSLAHLKKLMD
ncbi:MAG: sugar phosphate isomerase/epimerase [Bacilli bacterium]|nr:sugar phosphate isomerase/epimerase [Bacilli bacterium]